MIELSLLKCFSIKSNLENYKHLVNPKSLSQQSLLILKDYEVYFAQNPPAHQIDFSLFCEFFFNVRNPYFDDKTVLEYKEILSLIQQQDIESTNIVNLIKSFEQQEFYEKLKNKLDHNVDIITVREEIEQFIDKNNIILPISNNFEDMNLDSSLEYCDRTNGYSWRCEALRKRFKIILGDFILIAGFVGSGKTSFLASELSYMAQQLNEPNDYILWLSSEGDWKSILPRVYSATLNKTIQELTKFKDRAKIEYKEKMKGNENRVRIMNMQGWNIRDIEKILKKNPPKILAIDLLDAIRGFEKYNSNEGSFEVYSKLYQWAREIATKYCPVLGISQLNGEAEDQMYPKMSLLRGSRIDKQSAACFQLMIGSIQGENTTRYLSMPKEKDGISNWKCIVKFDPSRSRYI